MVTVTAPVVAEEEAVSVIGGPSRDNRVHITVAGRTAIDSTIPQLRRLWSALTWRMQSLRDNPACAQQEYDNALDEADPGMTFKVTYKPDGNPADRTDRSDVTDLTAQERRALYAPWLESADAAVRANALICLINQANYLLDQQIAALEKQFVQGGGYSEQLATARLSERHKAESAARNKIPLCPKCAGIMVLRNVKSGKAIGKQFWGCSKYPGCKGTTPL